MQLTLLGNTNSMYVLGWAEAHDQSCTHLPMRHLPRSERRLAYSKQQEQKGSSGSGHATPILAPCHLADHTLTTFWYIRVPLSPANLLLSKRWNTIPGSPCNGDRLARGSAGTRTQRWKKLRKIRSSWPNCSASSDYGVVSFSCVESSAVQCIKWSRYLYLDHHQRSQHFRSSPAAS